MQRKPVGAAVGALLSGVLMSGCGFGRMYYEGSSAYAPPPAPASIAYSQVPGWAAQTPRIMASAHQPMVTQVSATAAKPEPAAGTMEVTTSLQLISGSNAAAGATPMLMISMPAIKILVPVNTLNTSTPASAPLTTECAAPGSGCGTECQPCPVPNATRQLPPMTPPLPVEVPAGTQATPSVQTIQPAGQTVPAQPSGGQVKHLPAFTPSGGATPGAAAPRTEDTAVHATPLPSWPKANDLPNNAANNDAANPPPPPPIPRQPVGAPSGQ